MSTKKHTYYFFIICTSGVFLVLGFFLSRFLGNQYFSRIDSIYITDFNEDTKLVGASHNIIKGKIISKGNTISLGELPATIFQVEVLGNIKGELNGVIDIIQEGGCDRNGCYVSEGDIVHDFSGGTIQKEDISSLKKDDIYILALRTDDNGRFILNSHPKGKYKLGDSTQEVTRNIKRYEELKKAYTNEEILEADQKNGKDKNAFIKLPKNIQEKIIKELNDK